MKHWRYEVEDGICIASFDMADRSANVLSAESMGELEALVGEIERLIEQDSSLKGVIFRSAKDRNFIVGADITEFRGYDAEGATGVAQRGQEIFSRIEKMGVPTVALIHGNALGGGLEMALACDYRIASDDPSTRLGLPEVMLGINPGFGGTIRLPRLVGPFAALDMMLSGRALTARAARRAGLVDDAVPLRHLDRAGAYFIEQRPKKRRPALWLRIASLPFMRPVIARLVARQLAQKARRDHYPAPWRILKLWTLSAGYGAEARALGELLDTPASRNLVKVFLGSEALKRHGKGEHKIRRVHVIGAGVMGGDIASWAAYKGFTVSLQDRSEEALARAMGRAYKLFKKKLKETRLIDQAMDRLMPDMHGDGMRRADMVIEAVVENLKVKREVFAHAESVTRADTILATNTSAIPLEEIATALKNPARLVGLHFFNPVAKMQLVEIVRGDNSGDEFIARTRAFTGSLSRLPLDVKSSPGFLINRILMPYLMEAMTMVEEGVPLADIDRAALDFGMPMGPIHLADTVGLDICLSVAEELAGPLGMAVPERLRQIVESGRLGKKTGRGFYRYDKKGQPVRAKGRVHSDPPLADRLILRQVNEAIASLRESVLKDAHALDTGMVFGTGFAPFLGGPLHYAEFLSFKAVVDRLKELEARFGERFRPDEGWADIEQIWQEAEDRGAS